jgi:hypothetical protein
MIHPQRLVVAGAGCLAALLTFASPAAAQFFGQPSDLPIGEDYHVEVLGGMWSPTPDISISSEAFGIAGTTIDFANDLGIAQQRFGELRLRLRPGRKHRFRIDYVPISYSAQTEVERRLVFRGIAYDIGVPVSSNITWRAWRLGYEYDVIHRSRGYFGVILEARYTDVEASLDSAFGREFSRARGPIPAIGGIIRIYPLQVLAVTAEVSYFRLPTDLLESFQGEYVDYDISGTLNFTEQIGAQVGYRSLNLNVTSNEDVGDLKLDGIYLGALLRF